MIVYNYSRKDESKQLVDSQTVSTVTTTYIGKAKRATYKWTWDKAKAIRSIEKRVEDTSTWLSERYRPNGSADFEFIWNDRATITPYV